MNAIKAVSVVFFLIALSLAFMLYKSIEGPILERKRVKADELAKIEKLKTLREVQKVYLSVHGKYAGNWDQIINFIQSDTVYNIERSEEIIVRQYGGDSVIVHIDTVGAVAVWDRLFPKDQYPGFKPESLPNIPGTDKQFVIFADRIEKNKIMVDVFEIKDRTPISYLSELRSKGEPLRVGSREEVTTTGNWE